MFKEVTKEEFYKHIGLINTSIFTDTDKHLQTFKNKGTNNIIGKVEFSQVKVKRSLGLDAKYFIK